MKTWLVLLKKFKPNFFVFMTSKAILIFVCADTLQLEVLLVSRLCLRALTTGLLSLSLKWPLFASLGIPTHSFGRFLFVGTATMTKSCTRSSLRLPFPIVSPSEYSKHSMDVLLVVKITASVFLAL